jgi:hypothetical protein
MQLNLGLVTRSRLTKYGRPHRYRKSINEENHDEADTVSALSPLGV